MKQVKQFKHLKQSKQFKQLKKFKKFKQLNQLKLFKQFRTLNAISGWMDGWMGWDEGILLRSLVQLEHLAVLLKIADVTCLAFIHTICQTIYIHILG